MDQSVDDGKNKRFLVPKKGSVQTIDTGKSKNDGKLKEHIEQLNGCPGLLIEKFEDLFNKSKELTEKCSKFSQKDISESFSDLELEAITLVKKKKDVSDSIETLFQEYIKQKLPRKNPEILALKRESGLIIEQSQKSIENCRPLINEVRQKQKAFAF